VGLVLDSTVFIAAERRGLNAHQTLTELAHRFPDEQFAICSVTLMELAHGIARADTPQRAATRRQFVEELVMASHVHDITVQVALRAGQIDGECTARGVRIPVSDLLIGVTALELGYKVLTANLRHFQVIPGLLVEPI
jgi:tRNA(fMet)-specific endonuclease VapC